MNLLDYIKGLRKGKAARRIEIDAMCDPFLAEALEGFDAVGGDHAAMIATMQKQVSARTRPKATKLWLPVSGVAAAAVAVLLYFTVFEKQDADYLAMESLYVYVPDDYVEKKQISEYNMSPKVEVANMDMLAPVEQLEVYVPDEYVEKKKRTQVFSESEQAQSSSEKTSVVISNLDELFAPEEPIDIYLPEDFMTKEKQNISPRVQIDNILN